MASTRDARPAGHQSHRAVRLSRWSGGLGSLGLVPRRSVRADPVHGRFARRETYDARDWVSVHEVALRMAIDAAFGLEVGGFLGCLTGIASGKTTVANLLAGTERCRSIPTNSPGRSSNRDARPGPVVTRFGEQVLTQTGRLDRQALGEIVFADAAARADLNAIIHPLVRRRRAELIAQAAAGRIVVSVIPLLVETGLVDQFDAVVVVDVPSQTQVARLVRRNDISQEQAQARLNAQASRAERLAAADWVVTNSGSRAELEAQVERLWSQMRSKAQGCEPGK